MDTGESGLLSFVECIEHFSQAFLKADSFREQIHLAGHIHDHLRMIEDEIERLIKGQPAPATRVEDSPQPSFPEFHFPEFQIDAPCDEHSDTTKNGALTSTPKKSMERHLPKFRNLTLVEAGEILLKEHPELHGKELERLIKDGGYRSKAEHFQKMLQATFTRDGRFENVGLNRWRLKPLPQIGQNGDGGAKAGGEERPDTPS
jgi:hypothetical protein